MFRDPKYARMMDIPKMILHLIAPKFSKFIGLTVLDKKITAFFINIVRTTMENRR